MTQFEFEIERDRIELEYDRKKAEFENQLCNLDAQEADLKKQSLSIMQDRIKATAMIDELIRDKNAELLELRKEYFQSLEQEEK